MWRGSSRSTHQNMKRQVMVKMRLYSPNPYSEALYSYKCQLKKLPVLLLWLHNWLSISYIILVTVLDILDSGGVR